jgi:hypothetical protein
MNYWLWTRTSLFAMLAAILLYPMTLCAQGTEGSFSGAATALTGEQQSAANRALCSALASHVPNPTAASPTALSDPTVLSPAASMFAGNTHLPLPSATDLLKGYVSQHATDILASCAVNNATGGQLPNGSSLPSMPKMP